MLSFSSPSLLKLLFSVLVLCPDAYVFCSPPVLSHTRIVRTECDEQENMNCSSQNCMSNEGIQVQCNHIRLPEMDTVHLEDVIQVVI